MSFLDLISPSHPNSIFSQPPSFVRSYWEWTGEVNLDVYDEAVQGHAHCVYMTPITPTPTFSPFEHIEFLSTTLIYAIVLLFIRLFLSHILLPPIGAMFVQNPKEQIPRFVESVVKVCAFYRIFLIFF
jgi:hypothetical protein